MTIDNRLADRPADDDQPCPCGKSHTITEHNYDPDAESDEDSDDEVPCHVTNEAGVGCVYREGHDPAFHHRFA